MFQLKRRRNQRTNYKRRLGLLKSGKPRLVVRKTNTQIIGQIVEYNVSGDKTLIQADGNDIRKAGWKAPTKNLPAAYLIGLLLGSKAKEEGVTEVVLDIGLQTTTQENKMYALAKGVLDAGVDLPLGENVMPSEDRIKGNHISNYATENPDNFSDYGIDPKNIQQHFEDIKKKIMVKKDE